MMKKIIQYVKWVLLFMLSLSIVTGCHVTRAITVEYLPGSEEMNWIQDALTQIPFQDRPTIAFNHFRDERDSVDAVGGIYNRSGKKVETLITDEKPADILEKALIAQLEKAGFKVIQTSGWDLNPETIPGYLNADFILGGRLKAFWVESRAGLFTSAIHSKVCYDLIIADTRNQKIIWTGRISSLNTKKSIAHTNDYFWADLQKTMNKSLTQAVNQTFQDEQARKGIITLIRIKF